MNRKRIAIITGEESDFSKFLLDYANAVGYGVQRINPSEIQDYDLTIYVVIVF